MVVLVRLLLAIFRSYRRPGIHLSETGVISTHVWPNDLDLNFHMNDSRYLAAMDIGRVALLAQTRILDRVLAMKWRPVVGGVMIRYRRSLHLFDRFDVRTRVVCWDEKWFYFEHVIESDGVVCAEAFARGLFRGDGENIAPAELLAIAGDPDRESPPMPDAIVHWWEADQH